MARVSKYKLNEAEKNRIEGVVARLRNAVDTYNIMRWLENFKDEDRTHALTVLENMEYRTVKDIYAIIQKHLSYLREQHPRGVVYMVPVRELGKSGSLIAYYANKINPRYLGKRFVFVSADELHGKTIRSNSVLCLMDDFVGSGDTVKVFYADNKQLFDQFTNKYAFLIGYMPKGKAIMDALGLHILGDKHEPVFHKRGSVFGYEPRMRVIREFAYRYGKKLSPKRKRTKQHPLGYANSQALIAFDYTTPNNTLPILWSAAKNGNAPWYPLFPRRGDDAVKQLSDMRRNYWMWLSANKRLTTPYSIIADGEAYTIEKVKLFMLIELMHSRRSRSTWEQIMGITSRELGDIIGKAKENGLIDDELRLTDNAIQLLSEVHKSRRKLTGEEIQTEMNDEANKYVPTKFMGGS